MIILYLLKFEDFYLDKKLLRQSSDCRINNHIIYVAVN